MNAEKPKAEPTPLAPTERDDVEVAANRCPYCHDSVSLDDEEWVSCWSCQARHHSACWQESGTCGSCGEGRYLSAAGALPSESPVAGALSRGLELARGPVRAALARKPLAWVLGVTAVLAALISLGDGGADQGIGYAVAVGAGAGFVAALLRVRRLFVGASLFGVLGVALAVAHRSERHIRHNHQEVLWLGLGLLTLGLILGAIGLATRATGGDAGDESGEA